MIEIKGSKNKYYKVDLENITCTCSDFVHRKGKFDKGDGRRLCKHIKDAIEFRDKISGVLMVSPYGIEYNLSHVYVSNFIISIENILNNINNVIMFKTCGQYTRNESVITSKIPIIISVLDNKFINNIFDLLESIPNLLVLSRSDNILEIKDVLGGLILVIKVVDTDKFNECIIYNSMSLNDLIKFNSFLKRSKNMELTELGIIDLSNNCYIEDEYYDIIYNEFMYGVN